MPVSVSYFPAMFGNPVARAQRAEVRFNALGRCVNSIRRFKAMQSLRARCRTQEKAPLLARLHELHRRKTLRFGYVEVPIDLASAKQVLKSFKPVFAKMTDCTAWKARLTALGRKRFEARKVDSSAWTKYLGSDRAGKKAKRACKQRSWPEPWYRRVLPDAMIRFLSPNCIFDRRQMMIERLREERKDECPSWEQAQVNRSKLDILYGAILGGQRKQFYPDDQPRVAYPVKVDLRSDPRYDDDFFHKALPA